eukprot:3343959-Prymnesium_polylepis.1
MGFIANLTNLTNPSRLNQSAGRHPRHSAGGAVVLWIEPAVCTACGRSPSSAWRSRIRAGSSARPPCCSTAPPGRRPAW